MSKKSKKAETHTNHIFTSNMITPLQMEIIQVVNDIGTDIKFTAQTILNAISPQEIPLTTEEIDTSLRRMMQITVECDINPIYTHPKSKKSDRHKQTIFGRLLDLRGGQLSVFGMEEETYVLSSLPIVLRYEHTIEMDCVETVSTDMPISTTLCEDESLNKNKAC